MFITKIEDAWIQTLVKEAIAPPSVSQPLPLSLNRFLIRHSGCYGVANAREASPSRLVFS